MNNKQSGLALITVLMIFAIASVLAIAMVERQAMDMQRSATMFAVQQARAFAIGAEDAVKTGLFLSWQADKEHDHLFEEWAKERRFPLQPGTVYIRIMDAQGRFNLNTLQPQANNKLRQQQRFINLLNLLGIDPQLAQAISNWMNPESQADDLYQSKELPYRAAYQGCKHTSEILAVDGMTMEIYSRLEPFVACLPITAALNVNTASPVLLASLDASLTLAQGETIANARGEKGFATMDEFMQLPDIEPLTKVAENLDDAAHNDKRSNQQNSSSVRLVASDFSLRSDYFEAFVRVDLNERIASNEVLIHRDAATGELITVYRDFSRREARQVPKLDSNVSTIEISNN